MTKTNTKFPQGFAYINGQYCPISEAKISVLDWGFLRSDATYDVVHVIDGRFFRLDKHLERFFNSVDKLKLKLPLDREILPGILAECVRRAQLESAAYVEMICTRGVSPTFSRDPRDAVNHFIAFAVPLGSIATPKQRQRGLHMVIAQNITRISPYSIDPRVKNYHWLDFVTGLYQAYETGGENVILTDGSGNIVEGPGFNVFAVTGGCAITPATGMLEGITRQTALDLCAELKIDTRMETLSVDALMQADEAFITSTAGGIMPLTQLDGKNIGDGTPGFVTKKLDDLYWKKHTDPAWSTPVDHY